MSSNPSHLRQNIKHLRTVLANAVTDGERLIHLNRLAFFMVNHDPIEAMNYAQTALQLGRVLQAKQHITRSLNVLGKLYLKKEAYSKALLSFSEALQISESLGDQHDMVIALSEIGVVFLNKGEYEKAINSCEQALELAQNLNNEEITRANVHNLGVLHKKQGNYEKAKEYYFKALELNEQLDDKQTKRVIINNIGNIYQHQGEFEKAIQYYLQALRLNEELGNKNSIAANMNNLGIIYRKLKNFSKAIEYYRAALKINTETDNKQGIATNLSNLGSTYELLNDYEAAAENYKRALSIDKILGNKQGIVVRMNNLGSVYVHLGEFEEANKYYIESLKLGEELGFRKQMIAGLDNLGRLNEITKKYGEAINFFERSLDLAKEIGAEAQTADTYKSLANCHAKQGNFEMAYHAHCKFSELNNNILMQSKGISEIQNRYDSKEKDDLIELLRDINKELQLFANKAAHELKEPVRMIGSFASLLKRKHQSGLNEDGKEFVDFIKDAAYRMDELINNLFKYAKIGLEAQKDLEPVDLNKISEQTQRNLAMAIDENEASIKVDKLPVVMAVPSNMAQIFQNLISNSIKFRNGKKPVINIGVQDRGEDYLFSFKDNGIGIPKKHHIQVFEVFNRLHSQSEYEGSGIGLAICKRIIDQLRGQIWIDSTEGKGTEVFFTIPK